MKKISYVLVMIIGLLSVLGFTSCKKEKTEVNMIIKDWSLTSKTVLGVNVATDCEKTSKWNFKSDDTYVIKDDCNNTQAGTWVMAEDGKTLTLDNVKAYNVIERSVSSLVIELQVADMGLVRWSFN